MGHKHNGWDDRLYRPGPPELTPATVRAIPYPLWAHRRPGSMAVGLRSTYIDRHQPGALHDDWDDKRQLSATTPQRAMLCGLEVERAGMLTGISAITLATHNMARAVLFYQALGFALKYGGPTAGFTSLHAGSSYLNLVMMPPERIWSWWGRAIFYVDDVDAQYAQAVSAGLKPEFSPRDGSWGERYFHILDPDGHELSFACPIQ